MKLSLWVALLLLPASLMADTVSVNSTPAGIFTLNVAQSVDGTTPKLSVLSIPLVNDANVAGQVRGVITGVTSNTISNSGAGWTAGQLSSASAPMFVRITSGTAIGRTFLVSSGTPNTSTAATLTLSNTADGTTDISTLGIVAGTDTYEILAGYTLGTLLPSSVGVVGGSAPGSTTDLVQLFIGTSWIQFYYNTTSNAWLRAGNNANSNNVVIRPDTAVLYSRIGTSPISLVLTGSVPTTPAASVVANSGVSFLANTWPVNLTLGTSNINNIPGWTSNANPSQADLVQLLVGSSWIQFYYDGTQWRRAGTGAVSTNVSIPAGASIIVSKLAGNTGATTLTQSIPYSL